MRYYLENEPLSALLVVLDATQLERKLPLARQLRELQRPLLVALNMAYETQRLGIRVATERLAAALGAPVLPVSGKHGSGIAQLKLALQTLLGDTAPGAAIGSGALRADSVLEAQAESLARTLWLAAGAAQASDAAKLQQMLKSEGCVKRHEMDEKKTGPSLKQIAADAKKDATSTDKLLASFRGNPKHKKVANSDTDRRTIIDWIKTL